MSRKRIFLELSVKNVCMILFELKTGLLPNKIDEKLAKWTRQSP